MSTSLVVTHGFGNGTLSGSTTKVVTQGYTPAVVVTYPEGTLTTLGLGNPTTIADVVRRNYAQGAAVAAATPAAEVWWPIVLRERRRRAKRTQEIAEAKLAKARAATKRKISVHVREGKPVTESALMKLAEASVKKVAPKAPADDREDAAIGILIELEAHIARLMDEEDAITLLLH